MSARKKLDDSASSVHISLESQSQDEKGRRRHLRLDAGQRDVQGTDGSEALVQGTDLVGDGEVDGGLDRGDRGVGALVKVASNRGHCFLLGVL